MLFELCRTMPCRRDGAHPYKMLSPEGPPPCGPNVMLVIQLGATIPRGQHPAGRPDLEAEEFSPQRKHITTPRNDFVVPLHSNSTFILSRFILMVRHLGPPTKSAEASREGGSACEGRTKEDFPSSLQHPASSIQLRASGIEHKAFFVTPRATKFPDANARATPRQTPSQFPRRRPDPPGWPSGFAGWSQMRPEGFCGVWGRGRGFHPAPIP